jgi:hypothetical protein
MGVLGSVTKLPGRCTGIHTRGQKGEQGTAYHCVPNYRGVAFLLSSSPHTSPFASRMGL